jgi:hypothetical protein
MNPWTIVKQSPLKKNIIQPWEYSPLLRRFDLNTPNENYYLRFDDFVWRCADRGLDLGISFLDAYGEAKWIPDFDFKKHPFRNNNLGIDWGSKEGVKRLYDSLIFDKPGGTNYWLDWLPPTKPEEATLQFKWRAPNAITNAIEEYVSRIIFSAGFYLNAKTDAGKLSYPRFRVFWKSHNEQRAVRVWDAIKQEWKSSSTLSRGDRSEIFAWISEIWKDNGCDPKGNSRFFSIVNRDVIASDPQDYYKAYSELHNSITRPYGVNHGLGALHEVHLKQVSEAVDLVANAGFDIKKTVFSSDSGTPEVGAEFANAGMPFADVLYEEAVPGNPTPAPPWEWQTNWDKAFPYHAGLLK